jgi:DNA-binding transcriptional LysR family regulator
MDTDLLRTFQQVARLGSITAAAHALGYTQSAVSRQVSALEASFGARLFDRRARGVQLTEHGRCMLAHAESLLERLENARRDLGALDRLDAGRLRLGAFPTANAALIPRAMAAFAAEHPNVSVSLSEGTTRRQLARLRATDIDLCVISAFPDQRLDTEGLRLVHLLDDVMLLAFPGSHRLAGRRVVRLAELAQESWIGADASEDDHLLGPARLRSGFEPRFDFAVREWTAKLGLVAAGLGITLVPSLAAGAARADIALARLHPDDVAPRAVYAAVLGGLTSPPAVEAFIATLHETTERFPPAPAQRCAGEAA